MDSLEGLERILQAVAFCNIMSGIPGSVKMWRTGKTDGWPTLFFVIGLCGALGMTLYGFLLSNSTLLVLNGLQAIANIYYILSYIILADTKTSPMIYLAGASAYLTGLYSWYISYDDSQLEQRLNLIGSSSSIIFLIMNSSTILDVIATMQSKSVTFDIPMLGFGMLNNVLWATYGLLLNDMFLYGPPLPFVLTGLMKFMLLSIYSRKDKKKSE